MGIFKRVALVLSVAFGLGACSVGTSTADMRNMPSPLTDDGTISGPDRVHEEDQATVAEAYRFGLRRAGLEIDQDEEIEHGAIRLIAHLPSFVGSDATGGWGQYVRIVVSRAGSSDGKVEVDYVSRKRFASNITENLSSVRHNVMMQADNYLVAVAEGLDPEEALSVSPDTTNLRP